MHAKDTEIIIITSVAGTQHHTGKHSVGTLKVGQELNLIPDPKNQYDRFAVAILAPVDNKPTMFGYVPGTFSRTVANLMKNGIKLKCILTGINQSVKPLDIVIALSTNNE